MTVTMGVVLMLLVAIPTHAQTQTYHLRSIVVSLGGEDSATLLGPDLLAGHITFHQTFGECAFVDCSAVGTWYVIDRDGNQLGGTYSETRDPCLGSRGGDLVVNWGFGKYAGIHGTGTYGLTETYAAAGCLAGVGGSALGWSGTLTLDAY